MNFEISFDLSDLENSKFLDDRDIVRIQGAMAERFFEITRNNFGFSGEDRPIEWEPLKDEKYAKKVGRDYASLFLTGDLESSINIDTSQVSGAVVWIDDGQPYAQVHQWGYEEGGIPARPFFPMFPDGSFTSYTFNEVTQAAEIEFNKIVSK